MVYDENDADGTPNDSGRKIISSFQSSVGESASPCLSILGVFNRRERVLQTALSNDFGLYFKELVLQISWPHSGEHQHPFIGSEQVGRGNFRGSTSHSRLQEPTEFGSCTAAVYAVSSVGSSTVADSKEN